ncbi:MAG: 3D domain-containing protein [Planctomycetes bacterium]|nr:3D domain-containing protein [Planctomycetota bacterium]
MGFIIGVLFVWLFPSGVEVIERVRTEVVERFKVLVGGTATLEYPKPVTPPPPGMAWVKALTTGYCACEICCPGTSDNKTSVNRDVREHPFGIASDPKLVKPWTALDIPGYGHAIVDDTGGAMRQAGKAGIVHFDLRFHDHQTARTWGRRWIWIAVPADAPAAKLPEPETGKKKK